MLQKVLEDGISVLTLIGVLNVLLTWYESRRKRKRYERMEAMLEALAQKEGVTWNGPSSRLHTALTSLEKSLQSYSAGICPGVEKSRRRGKMKLNKAWLVGLLGYIAYFVKQLFGIEVSDELIDKMSDLVLLLIMVLPMILNMAKKKKEVDPVESQYQPGDNK
ncbi:hypothetical protein WMW72_10565 [Paenibacillus filicis]|uniref:Uncharacterized protein n=1 Tax=Paenibacillus filicis TaxID=669464 RepID=A0ABU9DHK2_9BACL